MRVFLARVRGGPPRAWRVPPQLPRSSPPNPKPRALRAEERRERRGGGVGGLSKQAVGFPWSRRLWTRGVSLGPRRGRSPGRLGAAAGAGQEAAGQEGAPAEGAQEPRRRFVLLMHHELPECACSMRLVALDQSRLDLACRCISSALLVSDGVRRDTEVLCVFPAQQEQGVWVLRLSGREVAHLRPDERNIASVIRRAMFPTQCSGEVHVGPVETAAHEAWCEANPMEAAVVPKGMGRRNVGRGGGEGSALPPPPARSLHSRSAPWQPPGRDCLTPHGLRRSRPWRNTGSSNKCARGVSLSRGASLGAVLAGGLGPVLLLSAEAATPPTPTAVSRALVGGGPEGWTVVLGDQVGLTWEEEEQVMRDARAACPGAGVERLSLGPLSLHAHQCVAIVQNHLDLWLAGAGGEGGVGPGGLGITRASQRSGGAARWAAAGASRARRAFGGTGRRGSIARHIAHGARGRPAQALAGGGELAGIISAHPRRLDKFLFDCGVANRQGAKLICREQRATVNGSPAHQSVLVDPCGDVVLVDGARVVLRAPRVYALLNKPPGLITAMSDPYGRPCVGEVSPKEWAEAGATHVGRLDAMTTGALIFTDDGDLSHLLSGGGVWKSYTARVAGGVAPEDPRVVSLREPMDLGGGLKVAGARVTVLGGEGEGEGEGEGGGPGWTDIEVLVKEGKNQQVRRMVGAAHLSLVSLHRGAIGPLVLGGLPPGGWRDLSPGEVEGLYDAAGGRAQVAGAARQALLERYDRGTLEGRDAKLAAQYLGL